MESARHTTPDGPKNLATQRLGRTTPVFLQETPFTIRPYLAIPKTVHTTSYPSKEKNDLCRSAIPSPHDARPRTAQSSILLGVDDVGT